MATRARSFYRFPTWGSFSRLRRTRLFQNIVALFLVALGPVLSFATFMVLGPLNQGAGSLSLRLVLLADLVYVLLLAALLRLLLGLFD